MPLLFSLGQHQALEAVQRQLLPDKRLLAFLDDIHTVTSPERVGPVYKILQSELWNHSRIRIHCGKTQVWNRAGVRPEACAALE